MASETPEDASPGSGVLYLELEDVIAFYADIFGYTEQEAIDRLRSPDGLGSALARPKGSAQYEGLDIAHQAAVLVHGIAEGQHFLEGNKRVALASLLVFLSLNGYALAASQGERFRWMIELSTPGDADVKISRLAEHIRASLTPLISG